MIKLGNQENIDQVRGDMRKQITNNYTNTEETVAITKGEFDESYPSETFEHYSSASLKKFVDDFKKSEEAENEDVLATNLKGLTRVTVSDGELIAEVYVREKEVKE
jgi:hypothetical protein